MRLPKSITYESSLHLRTVELVRQETKLTIEIIECLQKNYDDRLYLQMGYSSLFEYATKGLGYSESCAVLILQRQKIDSARLQINLSNSLMAKLNRIRNLRAHKNPNMNYAELIEDMADYILRKLDPEERAKHMKAKRVESEESERKNVKAAEKTKIATNKNIPQKTRLKIWTRDHGQCSYYDPKSQRRCESRHLLQLDHIVPRRENGENNLENLRLLCHAHHRLRDQVGQAF